MASRRFGGLLLASGLLLLTVAGCARPTGDFGRAQPGFLHDEILPAVGRERADLSGEPASRFNQTDQEREMHDRVWRYLVAPHADDWFHDTAVELRRTRLAKGGKAFNANRYYRWLQSEDFRSSRVRYSRVADDVRADIATMPTTFAAICAVIHVDQQRAVASRELKGLEAQNVHARRAENEAAIGWFVQAASWRYDAYSYALDHLLVETPHEEALKVNESLSDLARWVERAQSGDFCGGTSGRGTDDGADIPSRVLLGGKGEGQYQK